MPAILTATGRVLWRHWPALLAWLLGGMLVRHLLIELAGLVGGHSSTGGLLILPLAVLARLIGFVGMFLVIRDGLRALQAVAPLPVSARERRQDFVAALLASVLPFFAVYAAQRELKGDIVEYAQRALDERLGQIGTEGFDAASDDVVLTLTFNVWTVLIIVLAFAGRWAWKRWADRLPRTLTLIALYLEVVWVFFSLLLLSQVVDEAVGWIETREAVAWLADVRVWIADSLVPVDWAVRGVELFFADAGRVIVAPIAWLTVAGVIYGQAIAAEKLRVESRVLARARARSGFVPAAVRARVAALTDDLTSRFRPIGDVLTMIWRSGPLVIASFLVLYAVVSALPPLVGLGLVRLIGPHDGVFWTAISALLALVPLLLIEPIRVSLIAGTYDTALRRATANAPETADAPETAEAQEPDDGQGSTGNRANAGAESYGATSSQNGPSASSGTMNGTSIS